MASTSGVAEAATRSLPMSIRRSFIHCRSMYVNHLRSSSEPNLSRHPLVVRQDRRDRAATQGRTIRAAQRTAIAPAAMVNSSTRQLPCLTDAAPYEEIEITMVAARPERAQEES